MVNRQQPSLNRPSAQEKNLADQIDDLLPQTQCTQCGYAGCRPYAEAIASGHALYNQCPPGGTAGIERLATLLGVAPLPLNPLHGSERPRTLAVIAADQCIGCTLCIQACPVDAIVGAPKQMHVVINDWCTGCNLCIPPCPVDCISTVPADPAPYSAVNTTFSSLLLSDAASLTGQQTWSQQQALLARSRYRRRQQRLLNNDLSVSKNRAETLPSISLPPTTSALAVDHLLSPPHATLTDTNLSAASIPPATATQINKKALLEKILANAKKNSPPKTTEEKITQNSLTPGKPAP